MAAGGSSSEWLKISHYDTEKAVMFAALKIGAAEPVWFSQCWCLRFELRAGRSEFGEEMRT
jgi:hypothetical protein